MKKFITVLLCICIFIFAVSTSAYAVNTAQVKIGTVSGKAGDTVAVDIELVNNPGLIALLIKLSYDNSKLQLISIDNGDVFSSDCFMSGNDISMIPYTIYWDDALSYSNNTKNGILATLRFIILEDTQPGELTVSATLDRGSTFDVNLNEVDLEMINGKINVLQNEFFGFIGTSTLKAADSIIYVYGFRTSMTEAQFRNGGYFEAENVTVTVQKSSSRYMGTGSVITVTYASGKVEEYIVIIYGDIDGNAKVDTTDAMVLADTLTGESAPLAGAQKLAANVYGTGTRVVINDQDLAGISSVAAGEAEIDQTTGKVE